MADESNVTLLREIRDLQIKQADLLKAFVDGQQQGLKNQQQALANQQQVAERQNIDIGQVHAALGIRIHYGFHVALRGCHPDCD